MGTSALLVAAAGAVAAGGSVIPSDGQDIPVSGQPVRSTADPYVPQAAKVPARDTQRLSRSGTRPPLVRSHAHRDKHSAQQRSQPAQEKAQRQQAAQEQAAARKRELARAADQAEAYAAKLANQWVLPTSGFHISVWFGEAGPYWASGHHTGIDFATACGTPVVAVQDGVISKEGYNIGGWAYGNQIRLRLSNGDEVWYNHLSEIDVGNGEQVSKGEVLGLVGQTGNAYGCHLHFEYREAADLHTAVDPAPYFAEHGISLR